MKFFLKLQISISTSSGGYINVHDIQTNYNTLELYFFQTIVKSLYTSSPKYRPVAPGDQAGPTGFSSLYSFSIGKRKKTDCSAF